ncbi:MAG: molybdopterin-dependent oxidoreductase [bacterium]|nr:molybdopterin-dependent oxidoreductase [bacterium]
MAKVTIDGQEMEFAEGTRLFDACAEARGEALPHFCYHPDLSVAGVCRLCQVEVEGMPKLTIACNTFVRDGMVVHTRNEKVRKAARQILEMHLVNHPVDCPICDQAGECGLQNQYMTYGLYESEVEQADKVNKAKAEVIGPHVILDKERCVLCSRCVRFCEEVTKTGEMGIFNRGDRAEIGVAPGTELANEYSLNTVDICPVGALTSRDFRFQKRVWMLKSTPGVCPGCATGCNVRIDHEAGRIFRLKPRRNDEVNGPWMCDRGRMVYKDVHDEDRLTTPLLRGEAVAWADVEEDLARLLAFGSVGLAVGSARATLEENFLLKRLAERLGAGEMSGGLRDADRGVGDDILQDADRAPNRRGLEILDLAEHDAVTLAGRIGNASGTILLLGGDPAAAPEVAAALQGKDVVFVGTHAGATAALAQVVLPGAAWAETAGVFVNRQGRLQDFPQAIARPDRARETWRILVERLAAAGEDTPPASLRTVRLLLTEAHGLPDLNSLPAVGSVPAAGGAD